MKHSENNPIALRTFLELFDAFLFKVIFEMLSNSLPKRIVEVMEKRFAVSWWMRTHRVRKSKVLNYNKELMRQVMNFLCMEWDGKYFFVNDERVDSIHKTKCLLGKYLCCHVCDRETCALATRRILKIVRDGKESELALLQRGCVDLVSYAQTSEKIDFGVVGWGGTELGVTSDYVHCTNIWKIKNAIPNIVAYPYRSSRAIRAINTRIDLELYDQITDREFRDQQFEELMAADMARWPED